MSKNISCINVKGIGIIVDTQIRRVVETSDPSYDNLFRGRILPNEMATIIAEQDKQITDLQEQLEKATIENKVLKKALELSLKSSYYNSIGCKYYVTGEKITQEEYVKNCTKFYMQRAEE